MGTIWIIAPLAVAALGFLFFVGGAGHMMRGRAGRAGLGLGGGGALTIGGLAVGLFGLNLQSYSRLTYETPVAEVTIRAMDPAQKVYSVIVHRLDGSDRTTTCTLQGDDWLLSGRVQKWKPWANEIGLNATYSLDEISNYYEPGSGGNGRMITSCDIGGPAPKIVQYLPESWAKWLMSLAIAQDRRFGSANFMPLADGAAYRVIITQFGFNAEPENEAAARANAAR